jgi:hypothetical protein
VSPIVEAWEIRARAQARRKFWDYFWGYFAMTLFFVVLGCLALRSLGAW